jgi:hypothetical protein
MAGVTSHPSRSALVMGLSMLLLTAGCSGSTSSSTPPDARRSVSLRQSSDDIDVSGRAASPSAVYTTSAAIIYNASHRALTIVSARPRQLDGLEVVAVRIAPFGTGFAAGAGLACSVGSVLAGTPEELPTTAPIRLQSIGPGRNALPPLGRVVIGVDPPLAVARWLVVAYRLAPGRTSGSLHDFDLRYTSGSATEGETTVHFSVQLCLALRCASPASTATTSVPVAAARATTAVRP